MPGPSWVVSSKSERWGARTHDKLDADEAFFVDNAERAVLIAESSDPNANYDYNDYALCELDGRFWLFNTSGCSCPSPTETWCVSWIVPSKEEALAKLVPCRDEAFHELLRQVEKAGWTLKEPAPAPGTRYGW